MSFRGQVDVLVHFESFRNVDLYHQGIYFLKSTLYHKREGKLTFGKPLTIFNSRVMNQA